MKHTYYLVILSMILLSCTNQPKITTGNNNDTLQPAGNNSKNTVFVKDSTIYNPVFIAGLSEFPGDVKLIDNFIITGADTIFFPEELPINKEIVFIGKKGNKKYTLNVRRISLTNIKYSLNLSDAHNLKLHNTTGIAMLNAMFFLGSEIDGDERSGESYLSTQYLNNTNECDFSIRIGSHDEGDNNLMAKVIYNCIDTSKPSLTLNECPTLYANQHQLNKKP